MIKDKSGNTVTKDHDKRVKDVTKRGQSITKKDKDFHNRIDTRSNDYKNNGRRGYEGRVASYREFGARWHGYYTPWYAVGFCGGFYWGFNPFLDINTFFWNPSIYWFYNAYDPYIDQTWYGADFNNYPVLQTGFRYVGVFTPTEEFKDLGLDMTGLSVQAQAGFRSSMNVLGDQLNADSIARLGAPLASGDVVVNHYQTLPNDGGLVVEGYVAKANGQFAFKALLNFYSPESSIVFAPSQPADGNVSPAELQQLNNLNSQIVNMGGIIEGANSQK